MQRSDLLAAARTIRAELPQPLAGPPVVAGAAAAPAGGAAGRLPLADAAGLSAALDRLIDRLAAGADVADAEDELIELLTAEEPLRRRLDELLPDDQGEKDWAGPTGYQELPGPGDPVDAVFYACPEGDYRYPVMEVGEVVPQCPVHGLPLVAT
jgi:hypothetical protein